jgi:anaerobic ribonucleoside-triphosphate reductase activating protein
MKYIDTKIVFSEVPDEITLAINISGCPIHCKDCHSKYLWEDSGKDLNIEELYRLIKNNQGITCISFMGGDGREGELQLLALLVKSKGLKTCWYSGQEGFQLVDFDYNLFDYIKI